MQNNYFHLFITALLTLNTIILGQAQESQKSTHKKYRKNYKIGGYYPTYNAKYQSPSKIGIELYTDLYFFVATTNHNFEITTGDIKKEKWDKLAKEFVSECKKAQVTSHLSLGGWTGSRYFSPLVSTRENRTNYAHSIIKFAKSYGFQGIDLDWEFPSLAAIGCNYVNANDLRNYGLWVKEIKQIWPEVILTIASPISGFKEGLSATIAPASSLENIRKYADYINLMTYDVYGAWSKTTGPVGPLRATCADPGDALSVETAVQLYRSLGFKNEQLQIGIPGYARSYNLVDSTLAHKKISGFDTYIYQNKSSIIPPGSKTDDKPGKDVCGNNQTWGGQWTVQELVESGILSPDGRAGGKGYQRYFDSCSSTPFLVGKNKFFAYDDEVSTYLKAKFCKYENLGGIFFFDTRGPLKSTVLKARQALEK